MRKFHKLLSGPDSLYDHILPTKAQELYLRDSKNKIRDHLKKGIHAASVETLGVEHPVYPRFRTQGSWAYNSCVQPAHVPSQEMDWDYGVYLPVEALDEAGKPKVAAQAYFDLVEGLLADLCHREHWNPGGKKRHCIRVHIGNNAHVDIALYAAPADQFEEVNDRAVAAAKQTADFSTAQALLNEAYEISTEQSWEDFDGMMVATRDGIWEPSDAEEIAHWFRDQRTIHGDQLQRVWRDLKAWRDFTWKEGGPSSVCLMLIACRHFESFAGRDDRALARVAEHLPEALMDDIVEDGIDPGHNFNRLERSERLDASQKARLFSSALEAARTNASLSKADVIDLLRDQWGDRLPDRGEDIENESLADQVRGTPARVVPPPVIGSSYAG